jgi:hypothetical protein
VSDSWKERPRSHVTLNTGIHSRKLFQQRTTRQEVLCPWGQVTRPCDQMEWPLFVNLFIRSELWSLRRSAEERTYLPSLLDRCRRSRGSGGKLRTSEGLGGTQRSPSPADLYKRYRPFDQMAATIRRSSRHHFEPQIWQ